MLVRFRVRNFALIRDLDLSPGQGMNIITGETGAGKSILLGAMGLVLGERADLKSIMGGEEKCVVEAQFRIAEYKLQDFFEANDLDYDEVTILRREILANGKSRAFINDTPVQLNIVRELGLRLVDIHSQHETLLLNDRSFQLAVIDTFAGINLSEYRKKYRQFKNTESQLAAARETESSARKDQDYWQFLFDELEAANLLEDEQEKLEAESELLANAGGISQSCGEAMQLMAEGEDNLLDRLATVRSLLQSAARHHSILQPLLERTESSLIELKDISAEISNALREVNMDPQRLEEVNNRLNLIYNLQKKHRIGSNAELIALMNDLSEKLSKIASLDEEIATLEADLQRQSTELLQLAEEISYKRKDVFEPLADEINKLLAYVGMPHAAVSVKHERTAADAFTPNGIDHIEILFATNPGSAKLPIGKIASGGELSRLMLCVKTIMAGKTAMPTIIFDEIDTGISGETAQKVGEVMEKLADGHQVITVTHLPQIAARGETHFFVYKDGDEKSVNTRIRQLNDNERAREIAKMLSGDNPSEIAIATARELMG